MNMSSLADQLAPHTGSETIFRHPLFGKRYTEGVKHMADLVGAYWLIDLIFSHQISKKARATEFQVWRIVSAKGRATISMTDGNGGKPLIQQKTATDFPEGQLDLWYCNNTLYLPSEH